MCVCVCVYIYIYIYIFPSYTTINIKYIIYIKNQRDATWQYVY